MKRMLSVSLFLVIALCLHGCGEGKKPSSSGSPQSSQGNSDVPDRLPTDPPANPRADPPADPPADPASDELGRIHQELNNTEWQVRLVPQSGKGKEKTDVLRLVRGKFTSDMLATAGCPSSNYTLRIKNKRAEVETMQTSEKLGTIFWRIQLRDGKMRGVVVMKLKRGKDEVLSLLSTSSKKIQPPPPGTEKEAEKVPAPSKKAAVTPKKAAPTEEPKTAVTPEKAAPTEEPKTVPEKTPRPRR